MGLSPLGYSGSDIKFNFKLKDRLSGLGIHEVFIVGIWEEKGKRIRNGLTSLNLRWS